VSHDSCRAAQAEIHAAQVGAAASSALWQKPALTLLAYDPAAGVVMSG
jgi:hypothetical protein